MEWWWVCVNFYLFFVLYFSIKSFCRDMFCEDAWSWVPNVRSVPRTQAEGPGEWLSVARPQVRTRDGLPLGTPP